MYLSHLIKKCMNRNICRRISFSTQAQVQERLVYVDSQKINYLKVGKGPKNIVCFPGALGTIWSDFKPQIEGLNKEEFTIFVWEQPGHGKSRPPERIFTSQFFQEDADTGYKLVKALGLRSFSLLGWSDGGTAGLILAAKYPEVVEKLVVWGSNSYISTEDFENYEKIQNIDSWSENAKAPLLELYGEKLLREIQNSVFEANRAIVNQGGDISSSLLKHISCPTLILHGAKDPLVSLEHPLYLRDNIKGAKLHIFPEGKHNIHIRYAGEFNDITTKFLLGEDLSEL
ncbi:valacyclovir hydrolase-like [Coccinella septempunctata]|uniref:valacyclovir hydrolase-like n=1 Tax=Coccinella septempunctata TaxID=41139 RepID=UPI001D0841BD|nr:valacyclovir hydrolase-like [Coccinella septempunctata]